MEYKVRQIHMRSQIRPPPKIVRLEDPNGPKKPPLTREQAGKFSQRSKAHNANLDTSARITHVRNMLGQRDKLIDLTSPTPGDKSDAAPTPAPDTADERTTQVEAGKGKGKGKGKAKEAEPPALPTEPIDPQVEVKIEKLAESLDAMREAFQRVHAKTEQDIVHLRVVNQKEQLSTSEIWKAHDNAEYHAIAAGRITKWSA